MHPVVLHKDLGAFQRKMFDGQAGAWPAKSAQNLARFHVDLDGKTDLFHIKELLEARRQHKISMAVEDKILHFPVKTGKGPQRCVEVAAQGHLGIRRVVFFYFDEKILKAEGKGVSRKGRNGKTRLALDRNDLLLTVDRQIAFDGAGYLQHTVKDGQVLGELGRQSYRRDIQRHLLPQQVHLDHLADEHTGLRLEFHHAFCLDINITLGNINNAENSGLPGTREPLLRQCRRPFQIHLDRRDRPGQWNFDRHLAGDVKTFGRYGGRKTGCAGRHIEVEHACAFDGKTDDKAAVRLEGYSRFGNLEFCQAFQKLDVRADAGDLEGLVKDASEFDLERIILDNEALNLGHFSIDRDLDITDAVDPFPFGIDRDGAGASQRNVERPVGPDGSGRRIYTGRNLRKLPLKFDTEHTDLFDIGTAGRDIAHRLVLLVVSDHAKTHAGLVFVFFLVFLAVPLTLACIRSFLFVLLRRLRGLCGFGALRFRCLRFHRCRWLCLTCRCLRFCRPALCRTGCHCLRFRRLGFCSPWL